MSLKEDLLNRSVPDEISPLDLTPQGPYHPSPTDWRDEVLYFLLVDRFSDGHDATRPLVDRQNLAAARSPLSGQGSWNWSEWYTSGGNRWQGGTIKGVKSRLAYLQDLGVSAIWLSPIFKQRGHLNTFHGYGIQNFLDVDPRFGTRDDLADLIRDAHERGIRVILDIIFNHSGYNWNYPHSKEKPDYLVYPNRYGFGKWIDNAGNETDTIVDTDDGVWPAEFQHVDCYTRAGTGSLSDDKKDKHSAFEEYRRTDFENLRDFDLGYTNVLGNLIKCFQYWIALTDCDGLRIDTMKHVYYEDGRDFCGAIKEFADSLGKTNFLLLAEVAGGDTFQDNYMDALGRNLDAVLDIGNMRTTLQSVAKGFCPPVAYFNSFKLDDGMGSHRNGGSHHVSVLDDHDCVFGEKSRFSCESASGEQVSIGVAIQLFSLGIPCIYYGTEQSLMGGPPEASERYWLPKWKETDVYLREAMFGPEHPLKDGKDGVMRETDTAKPGFGPFGTRGHHCFDTGHEVYQRISKMIEVRRSYPCLRYGRQYLRQCAFDTHHFTEFGAGEIIAWSRILSGSEVLCVVNSNGTDRRGANVIVDANINPPGKSMKVIYVASPGTQLTVGTQIIVQKSQSGAAFVPVFDLAPSGIVLLGVGG